MPATRSESSARARLSAPARQFCGEEYPARRVLSGGDIKVLAGEFAEINGDKYVAACSGLDEEALFASEAFEILKNALVDYALPKNTARPGPIDYDVWFHESTLHRRCLDVVSELGACYKAEDPALSIKCDREDGAIMYRSAQEVRHREQEKTEDGTEEEAKDEVSSVQTASPPTSPPTLPTTATGWPPAALPRPSMSGCRPPQPVARMKGAMDAIGLNGNDLDVLMQMVNLMRDWSTCPDVKRTAQRHHTLTDLLEEVPIDSARFLFNGSTMQAAAST